MNIISLVSYPFLPARSGGQKGIALFYKYFSKYHSVSCVCTKKNDPSFANGYEVLNMLSDSPFRYVNFFIFFKIRRLIIEKKATHLILEHPYYGWLGILLKMLCRIKLVVHSHNIEGNRWKGLGKWWWRILWFYEKWTHRWADYNFFIQDEDKNYAITHFGLKAASCLTVHFGTEISSSPDLEMHVNASRMIHLQLGIPENKPLLLFNGAFGYAPNRKALENLIYQVNPILQNSGLDYEILICGLDIPERYLSVSFPSVHILGFVENLEKYLTGCQVFLNPVTEGGGIKTKLVEALAYNLNAVSSENGAIGIDPGLCNGKLMICENNDWEKFSEGIIQSLTVKERINSIFFDHFYWVNIAKKAADFLMDN